MDIYSIYIAIFFIVFLVIPISYLIFKCILWFLLDFCGCSETLNLNREQDPNLNGEQQTRRRTTHWGLFYDRQGNIFTISDETTGNTGANRYPDFFYLEPSSDEAARIRAQLEKDDKDLPSYDDVIRMTSLPTTPITPAVPLPGNITATVAASSSNPPPPPFDMTVPPYSEVDPNSATTSNTTTTAATAATASTSRGASVAIPVSTSASSTIV